MSDTGSLQRALQHAQETWQESERRFQAVWEHAPDAMAISTPDGTVIAANPAYLQLYGHCAEEVIGKNYTIIFSPEQRAWAQELYVHFFQSPTIGPPVEAAIVRAGGTERMVESRYRFLMQAGKRTAMLSIVRDITERKKTEEALRENALKLHLALEVGHMRTWDWDIARNTIRWSANVEEAVDGSSGTGKATYEAFLRLVHPQDRTVVDQAVRRALEEGADYQVEFRVVRPDGGIGWTSAHGQVLSDEAGKPMRMIGVSMDVTQFRHNDEAEQ
jgi:PAS domain S-box-containing protein